MEISHRGLIMEISHWGLIMEISHRGLIMEICFHQKSIGQSNPHLEASVLGIG